MLLRLLLALAWPVLGADAPLTVGPAAPEAALSIPALPASSVVSDLSAAALPSGALSPASLEPAAALPAATPGTAHSVAADLERLAAAAVEPPAGGLSAAQAGSAFFDAAGASAGTTSDPDPRPSISLPPGILRAQSHLITQASDVDRWIPDGTNSRALIRKLKDHIGEMAPYRVYRYEDAKGGFFTAIDLSHNPALVEVLPEQQSHEVKLIKKLQLFNNDLQVVVREEQKTPDIVLGGVVTELKSLIGNAIDFRFLLNKANQQVLEHATRHGLGLGAAAVDLTHEDSVDTGRALAEINEWADRVKKQGGRKVWLARVYVFGGSQLTIFDRQPNGTFAVSAEARPPIVAAKPRPPAAAKDVHTVQLLLKKGRVTSARRRERAMEDGRRSRSETSALAQARRRIDAFRFLESLRKLARKHRYASAMTLWDNFKTTRDPADVEAIQDQVAALLPALRGPAAAAAPEPAVAVYGSARIAPSDEVRKLASLIAPLEAGGPPVAHVFFPGGFRTMDQLFGVLTRMQSGTLPRAPIILVGERAYWNERLDFDRFEKLGLISPQDLQLFRFVDNADEAWFEVSDALRGAARR